VIAADHDRHLHGQAQGLVAPLALRGFLGPGTRRIGAARDRAEMGLHGGARLRLADVPDDHEGGVVGAVVGVVEALAIGDGHPLQVIHGAGGHPAVGVLAEGRRAQRLERASHRIVVHAQAFLLHHHLAFGVDRARQ
jgi:hypothetical protein